MDIVKLKQFLKEKGAIEEDLVIARVEAGKISEKEIDELIETYDPEIHEAANILGHYPKDNEPAYGWVKKLYKKGKELIMRTSILPELMEMVNKAMFKKRSIGWYKKDDPMNPTPGKIYLAHVAWLGAVPPAIKGMPNATFSGDINKLKTVEFSEVKKEEKIIKKEKKVMELTQEQYDAAIKVKVDEAIVNVNDEHGVELKTLADEKKDFETEIKTLKTDIEAKDSEIKTFTEKEYEHEVEKIMLSELKLKIIPANKEKVSVQLLKMRKLGEQDFKDLVEIYKAQPDIIELGEIEKAHGESDKKKLSETEKRVEEGTISITDIIAEGEKEKEGGK